MITKPPDSKWQLVPTGLDKLVDWHRSIAAQFKLDWENLTSWIHRGDLSQPPGEGQVAGTGSFNPTDRFVPMDAAGNVVIANIPTVAPGMEGQILTLYNRSVFNITLQDQGTLPGSLLILRTATVVLSPGLTVSLYWTTDFNRWLQL